MKKAGLKLLVQHDPQQCQNHIWVRWETKNNWERMIKVGLRPPKDDDFCLICRQSRKQIYTWKEQKTIKRLMDALPQTSRSMAL